MANSYVETGYCGDYSTDGVAIGPTGALAFRSNKGGAGEWELSVQADVLFEVPNPYCYRNYDNTRDVWQDGSTEAVLLTAQGMYFF